MLNTTIADLMAVIILSALLIATCFISNERGMETNSLRTQLANLEQRLDDLRPVPRVNIQRGTVYTGSGEIVIETKGEK